MDDSESNDFDKFRLNREDKDTDGLQQKLADFFPGIIYVYDTDNKKLRYVNKGVTDLLGYSYEDITGWKEDIMSMVFKEDVEMVKQELEKYNELKDEDSYSYNARLNHKKNNFSYFRTMGKVLRRDEKGKAASLLFIAQDITHEMKSEAEIKTVKQLAKETEELLQFGTWEWHADTDEMIWSDGIYSLFGYNKNEIDLPVTLDFYFKQVLPPDTPGLRLAFEKAIESKTVFDYTYKIFNKNKEARLVWSKAKFLFENGELKTAFGTTRDITEQNRLYNEILLYKEMILEKEAFLNQGSWEYDFITGVLSWSDGMYSLFGYDAAKDKASLTLNDEFYFKHMSAEEIERSKEIRDNYLKSDIPDYSLEFEISTIDKIKKRIETYGKFIRDTNNKPLKAIGTSRDVTRLRNYEFELERKLKELDHSNKELEEFAYVASHDLQEPLRKITSFGERLLSKFSFEIGEDGKMYLERMLAGTKNMRHLIDNLLEFSRTTRSNLPYEKTNLNDLMILVKTELELIIEETKASIDIESLPVIEAIPVQLRQLFNNIIFNAIKFRKPGVDPVIKVTCSKLSPQEKEQYHFRTNNVYYKIIISDNGIGFEQEYAERIFQIFQRLHGKSEYPGSGIGLSICKKIADNHRGLLFADGVPGQGASFTIILPEKHNN
jgi:PAS domain S-box-containing protein